LADVIAGERLSTLGCEEPDPILAPTWPTVLRGLTRAWSQEHALGRSRHHL